MSSTTPETQHLNVHPHAQSDSSAWIHQIFDAIAKNRGATFALAAVVIVVGSAGAWLSSRNDAKSEEAYSALFLARKTLSEELKALAQAKAGTPTADLAKGANKETPKAAPAASEESVRYDRFDVDAKLPRSVKALQALATGPFAGTRAAYEAQLVLGNLYFDHGDAARAAKAFESSVGSAPSAQEKAMAYSAQGRALENGGKYAEALTAYSQALGIIKDSSQAIQGELLLAQGRCYELLKDTVKARSVYDQIVSQMPASEYAKTAEALKTHLQ